MSVKFTYVGVSYLFLIRDEKILLQRRFQTGFKDGEYGVPAGHLDGGESARKGCVREIKEEIGVDLKVEDLEMVYVMHRNAAQDERIDFFFTTSDYSGEIVNAEPHKCDALAWFSLNELPENMVDYVCVALDAYQKGRRYSEFGY